MSKAHPPVLAFESIPLAGPLLGDHDFDVHCAGELRSGLELLGTRHFELVLLDPALGGVTDLENLVRILTVAPHVPVIVLVSSGAEKLGWEALHLGTQDWFSYEGLTATVLTLAAHKSIARHRSQDATRRDRHLLEILMDTIPDAIYFKDAESRFLRISRSHAKIFKLTNPALAIGKTDSDFFSERHAHQALGDELQIMRTGRPLVGIEEMETWPDGTVTWVSTTKMPLRDPSGKIIGTFGISRNITARKKAQLALAERTRQLQQKNEQIGEELKMARELQLAMLPQEFPRVPPHLPSEHSALEFFSFYSPTGAVSGDFFDVVELSETAVGVFICDVMGHDVRAALVTAMVRALVGDLSRSATDPGQLLAQINRGLSGIFKQTGATMFATALYLIADLANGELRYASAAHPDALHLRRSQGTVEPLQSVSARKGPALGLFDDAVFPTCRRSMEVGDLVLLFTDGLIETESAGQEYFTEARLADTVRQRLHLPPDLLFKEVIEEIRNFSGQGEFTDDVSLVGMEIKRIGAAALQAVC